MASAGGTLPAGASGPDAPALPPAIKLRTPEAILNNGRKPLAVVVHTVPEKLANPAVWLPAPYSRSKCVPNASTNAPSAMAVPTFSSRPTNPASHRSPKAVSRAPPPATRSSLMPAVTSTAPAWVSATAPPTSAVSLPALIASLPATCVCRRAASTRLERAFSRRLPPTASDSWPITASDDAARPISVLSVSPRRSACPAETSVIASALVSRAKRSAKSISDTVRTLACHSRGSRPKKRSWLH